jgi:hypothetical protein
MTGSRLRGNQYFQGVPTVSFSFPAAALVPSGQAAFNIGIDYRSTASASPSALPTFPAPITATRMILLLSALALSLISGERS